MDSLRSAAALILLLAQQCFAGSNLNGAFLSGYEIVRVLPHDKNAFTQGLLYHENDTFYESTGLRGSSSVREVNLEDGKIKRINRMKDVDFGEGLSLWRDRLIQVAYQTNKGFIYNRENLQLVGNFTHTMQDGWGLTSSEKHIIGSDGTSTLYFMNPATLQQVKRVTVKDSGTEVVYLNELEFVKGEIWANIWQTECIARISPDDGRVLGWIILSGLKSSLGAGLSQTADVLNGIAWDEKQDRLFVTGKWWPTLFQISLTTKPAANQSICLLRN